MEGNSTIAYITSANRRKGMLNNNHVCTFGIVNSIFILSHFDSTIELQVFPRNCCVEYSNFILCRGLFRTASIFVGLKAETAFHS